MLPQMLPQDPQSLGNMLLDGFFRNNHFRRNFAIGKTLTAKNKSLLALGGKHLKRTFIFILKVGGENGLIGQFGDYGSLDLPLSVMMFAGKLLPVKINHQLFRHRKHIRPANLNAVFLSLLPEAYKKLLNNFLSRKPVVYFGKNVIKKWLEIAVIEFGECKPVVFSDKLKKVFIRGGEIDLIHNPKRTLIRFAFR
jgi:hypothetical protein